MKKTYGSSKTYTHAQGLSCCFRQWRAKSHCRFLHGYALEVKIEFIADVLDELNWVVDFGSMKPIKQWLEDMFDHKLLVAEDDPYKHMFQSMDYDEGVCEVRVVPAVGCEKFAEMIFDYVNKWLESYPGNVHGRVKLFMVEVKEHAGNSAAVCNRDA